MRGSCPAIIIFFHQTGFCAEHQCIFHAHYRTFGKAIRSRFVPLFYAATIKSKALPTVPSLLPWRASCAWPKMLWEEGNSSSTRSRVILKKVKPLHM